MDDSASANKFLKFYARQIGRENLELFYRKKVPWRATGDSDALDDTCQTFWQYSTRTSHFILNTNRRMFRLNLARKGFKVLFFKNLVDPKIAKTAPSISVN